MTKGQFAGFLCIACLIIVLVVVAPKEHKLISVAYAGAVSSFEINDDYPYGVSDSIPIWVVTDVCTEKGAYLGDFNIDQDKLIKKVDHNCKHVNDHKPQWSVTLKYAVIESAYTRKY